MKVPFVDLGAQYRRYKHEFDAAIQEVLEQTAFIGGEHVDAFERSFSSYAKLAHTVSCANGTDSLEVILDALKVGPGDEVLVPALSWISTAEVVHTRGAKPVFVDIDRTYTIDVSLLDAHTTENTKGIIPVHLYGCPANMDAICSWASRNGCFVLEDCAQAHGAEWNGQRIGTFGDAASFSFYPGKNLGAYGDAGAIATDNHELANHTRMLCRHGQREKHDHVLPNGRNSRLDGIHAAILNVKLRYIEQWTQERIAVAQWYREALEGIPVQLPEVPEHARHVFHLFVIQCPERDALAVDLKKAGISTGIHYPTPMSQMPCFAHLSGDEKRDSFASQACARILSLPIYPEMTQAMVMHVANEIRKFYA